MERNLRKERVGVVSSNKMDKTITVAVKWKEKHPIYGKFVNKTKNTTHMTRRMNAVSAIRYVSWRRVL
ncbi:ribosomal protein S17 [Porphyromonas gingivalis A7A1-28]|nr:ribosomal protein S17 [Porphyromonas gingivalis A7A1-28]